MLMKVFKCKICGSDKYKNELKVREMMFGTREVFDYAACANCGCYQLVTPVEDLSVYYPADYYSYTAKVRTDDYEQFKWKTKRLRNSLLFSPIPLLRSAGMRLTTKFYKHLAAEKLIWKEASILDVGCGSGELIIEMWKEGFTSVCGVDKFLPADIQYDNGISIFSRELEEMEKQFDVIMLHHAFEHVPDPVLMLQQVRARLRPGGCLMLRIPVVPSFAFEQYGESWVQMDAPRHLFLHSVNSIRLLAEKTGFSLRKTVYDSGTLQFWGSEQYQQDIPLKSPVSYFVNRERSIFTKAQIQQFKKMARAVNKAGTGDQAMFVLTA